MASGIADGIVVHFTEDVTGVGWTAGILTNTDEDTASIVPPTYIDSHTVLFLSDDAPYGVVTEAYVWLPPDGLVISPATGAIA